MFRHRGRRDGQRAADFAANIAKVSGEGRDVVVGVGLTVGDALGDAAKTHPAMTFIAVDGIPSTGHDDTWQANGVSLLFAEDQAGYLAGVLAASVSETDHIGVVAGPVVIPPMERYVEGFLDGAPLRSIRPSSWMSSTPSRSTIQPRAGPGRRR